MFESFNSTFGPCVENKHGSRQASWLCQHGSYNGLSPGVEGHFCSQRICGREFVLLFFQIFIVSVNYWLSPVIPNTEEDRKPK